MIKVAILQLDKDFNIRREELVKIKEICDTLAPPEMTLKYLCKENTNLILSEKVIVFAINRLTIRTVLAGTVPVFKALSWSDNLKFRFFCTQSASIARPIMRPDSNVHPQPDDDLDWERHNSSSNIGVDFFFGEHLDLGYKL